MRFVVPVASVNAGPNPRYFGRGRAVTWLNVVNDQAADLLRWLCDQPPRSEASARSL
jgi:hypothetical protein